MANKKWNGGRISLDSFNSSTIVPENIGDYNTKRVTIYGANMVMARHIPFITDGLKPVSRRALTSIYRVAKSNPTTMPNAIAETMKIHPHGDSSIYDCLILMAQPWKQMIPLIDSMDENYGSAAGFGDTAADARYLKTRLSEYTLDCFFSDYDEKVVEMKPSYDDNSTEPLYLPAKYPNLFINGSSGMAWGFATEIPAYNVRDVLEYTIHLIEKPDENFRDIVPDSPTGCIIINTPNFHKIQFSGYDDSVRSHSYILQSEILIDNNTLTITSLPPGRTTEPFFKEIDNLRESGKLVECTKVKNECQGENIKITLCFKSGYHLEDLKDLLINTKLGTKVVCSAQITVIDSKNDFDLYVGRYSVDTCLRRWIDFRRDFKRRFYHRAIVESKSKIHQINEMLRVFSKDNYSKTIQIIRNSISKEDLIHNLIREYNIDTVQANAVANMRQYENVRNIREKYKQEREKLIKESDYYIGLVTDTHYIDELIIEELKSGIKKYGCSRKSPVMNSGDVSDIYITNDGKILIGSPLGNETVIAVKTPKINDKLIIFTCKELLIKPISEYYDLSCIGVFLQSEVYKDDYFIITDKNGVRKINMNQKHFDNPITSVELLRGNTYLVTYSDYEAKKYYSTETVHMDNPKYTVSVGHTKYLLLVFENGDVYKVESKSYKFKKKIKIIIGVNDDECYAVITKNKIFDIYTNKIDQKINIPGILRLIKK